MAADSIGQIGLDLVVNRKQFDRQMVGIQGIAKKAGLVLAAAFSIKKLADFGKECVNLGSQLAEVDNVIQQAVPSMEKQIDSFAKNAIQQFGMSETAAKRYTGVFASMARGFKFSEASAASMATTLTGLSADIASFYDTSQDEAFTKLKGIFTGETEALKGIGIVMTQSALDAYALENGYNKTTKAMSEAEKVALRYAYVQDQLRFAEGDFARTSGSWANQVRILSEQFNALKATIGQGLINVLTPVIQVINKIIGKLMSLANAFKAFTELITGNKSDGGISVTNAAIQELADSAGNASEAVGGISDATNKAAKSAAAAKKSLSGIDKLNVVTSSSSGGSGSGGGGGYNADDFDMGEIDTTITDVLDKKTSALTEKLKELGSMFKAGFKFGFGDMSVLDSIKGHLDGIKESLKEIFTDEAVRGAADGFLKRFSYNLGKVSGSLASIGATYADNILGGIDKYLQQNGERIKEHLITMFDIGGEISGIIGNFGQAVAYIYSAFRSDDAKQVTADIIGIFAEAWMGIVELGGKLVRDVLDMFTAPFINNQKEIKESLEGYITAIAPFVSSLKKLVGGLFSTLNKVYDESVRPLIQSFRDGFSEITAKMVELYNKYILPTVEEWSEKFEVFREKYLQPLIDKFGDFAIKVIDVVRELWEGALKPFVLWFMEVAAPVVGTAMSEMQDAFFLVASVVSVVVGAILDVLGGLIDVIAGVITGDWKRVWEGIKSILSACWESMKAIGELAIRFLVEKISSNLLSLKSTWDNIWSFIVNLLKEKWEQMKQAVGTHVEALKTVISAALTFINADWDERWTMIKDSVLKIWETIKEKASEIFTNVKELISKIWDDLNDITDGAWNKMWGIIKGVINLIIGGVESMVNRVIDGVNKIIDAANSISSLLPDIVSVEVPKLSRLNLPRLAQGGYVAANTPQLAIIGDNRHEGEIVAPESKLKAMAEEVAGKGDNLATKEMILLMREMVAALGEIKNKESSPVISTRDVFEAWRQGAAEYRRQTGHALI